LQQVLWNLLSIAIKFTPSGGQVTLRVGRLNGNLDIEVSDTGEGITPEFMPHVFERFRQADMGQTRPHTGLGIGLALCRHLVELQNGTIEARSEGLGHGAVFSVRLPWSECATQAVDAADESPLGGPERLRGVAVLLVEDDANTREVMAWTLANAGATVVPVGSGAEALARLDAAGCETGAPDQLDIIISDLGLPDMSGYELIEQTLELRRARGQGQLPACAVSAHARDADRQRAIDAGYDLYLAKPVTPEQLIEAVEDLRDVANAPRPRAAEASGGLAGW
jgi:CheY-like chemotaxis protein